MDVRQILSSFAVAGIAIAIWGHLPAPLLDRPLIRRVSFGVIMGAGATLSMIVSVRNSVGMLIDVRGPLIGLAGFLSGPVAAVVTTLMALACRIYMGGQTALIGCVSISFFGLAGVACHRAAGKPPTILALGLFSTLIASLTMVVFTLLPPPAAMNFAEAYTPALALSFVGTFVFGLSLRRDERLRGLLARDMIYRTIIEALPDSLCAKDKESRFVAANPATARLMNVAAPADLIGKTDADFYPREMAGMFRKEELDVLTNKVVGPIDQEVVFADGSRRWLTSMKTPLLDARGHVTGILTHNRDVTDRKGLEAELLKTQGYLQEAMNNMADGLVLYDRDAKIRFCNRRYMSMFPMTADLRVAGTRFDDLMRVSVTRGEVKTTLGADDYAADRLSRLRESGTFVAEYRDGRSVELRTRALPEGDTLVLMIDVTAKTRLEQDLRHRATRDPLTGLANRAAFEADLLAAHAKALADDEAFAVMMLDLDRFKPVNDTYGHAAGDRLLVEVARRLEAATGQGPSDHDGSGSIPSQVATRIDPDGRERDGDRRPAPALRHHALVARLGGDEFALLVTGAEIEDQAVTLANRLIKALKQPFPLNGVDLMPGGSLGIAYFPSDAAEPFELLRLADKALYAVKTRGGGSWAVSTEEGAMRGAVKAKAATRSAA